MAKILVVDDSGVIRIKLKEAILKAGHEVVAEAENGLEALNQFTKYQPDLVTMDITMPLMDGITALKKIMETDPAAKVIMISAMGQQLIVLDSIRSGAKHFLVKPVEDSALLRIINEVLECSEVSQAPPERTDAPVIQPQKQPEEFYIENVAGTLIINISRDLSPVQHEKLGTAVEGLKFIRPLKIIVDFCNTQFMATKSLERLDLALQRLREAGADLKVVAKDQKFAEYLKTLKFDNLKEVQSRY